MPFTSDIDLIHSGDASLTPLILESIFAYIPQAECFRWQLRSVAENAPFGEAMKVNGIIPVNLMTLSTNSQSGIKDPWNGLGDIRKNNYRYIRNGFYRYSPLFKNGRDLEFLSVLLYLRVLLEADIDIGKLKAQRGFLDTKRVIEDSQNKETVIALQESAYLRTRLLYLLKNLYTDAHSQESFNEILRRMGLSKLLNYFGKAVPYLKKRLDEIRSSKRPVLVSSSWLGGDTFRFLHVTDEWQSGESAERIFYLMMRHNRIIKSPYIETVEGRGVESSLGQGQMVILASPALSVNSGVSSKSSLVYNHKHEFVHFAIPLQDTDTFPATEYDSADFIECDASDLAVILGLAAMRNGEITDRVLFPTLAVCHFSKWKGATGEEISRLFIRNNCWGILEKADQIISSFDSGSEAQVRFFVLASPGMSEAL
jgi:hypothetical protein